MKTIVSRTIVTALLLCLSSSAFTQKDATTTSVEKGTTQGGTEKSEPPVTFLGVETQPVSRTLTAQLGLPKGVGLVVSVVVPDSAAAQALKQHDILIKMNDQLLIESRQLGVLIRSYKDGDEVSFTLYRGGKEIRETVKLKSRRLSKAATIKLQAGEEGRLTIENDLRPLLNADTDLPTNLRILKGESGKITGATNVDLDDTRLLFSDDEGSLDLSMKDGKRTLIAKNAKGEEIFKGPVDTPEDHKALPAAVRERFKKMENLDHLSFEKKRTWEAPSPRPFPYPQLMSRKMRIEAGEPLNDAI